MLLEPLRQPVMVDALDEGFQVGIHDPAIAFPNIALRLPDSLMRIPVGPKAVTAGVECRLALGLAPTMPSADACPTVKADYSVSSRILRHRAVLRGKTRLCRCTSAGFTKCIPIADGGLHGHVPARPERATPHIRFLFIALQLWVRLPSDPSRDDALAVSLAFNSAKTWQPDFHRPAMHKDTLPAQLSKKPGYLRPYQFRHFNVRVMSCAINQNLLSTQS